jgi:hypothetical protein
MHQKPWPEQPKRCHMECNSHWEWALQLKKLWIRVSQIAQNAGCFFM